SPARRSAPPRQSLARRFTILITIRITPAPIIMAPATIIPRGNTKSGGTTDTTEAGFGCRRYRQRKLGPLGSNHAGPAHADFAGISCADGGLAGRRHRAECVATTASRILPFP